MINCENYLCIYWNEHECLLDSIDLDSAGTCQSCMYCIKNDEELDKIRKKELEKIDPNIAQIMKIL